MHVVKFSALRERRMRPCSASSHSTALTAALKLSRGYCGPYFERSAKTRFTPRHSTRSASYLENGSASGFSSAPSTASTFAPYLMSCSAIVSAPDAIACTSRGIALLPSPTRVFGLAVLASKIRLTHLRVVS